MLIILRLACVSLANEVKHEMILRANDLVFADACRQRVRVAEGGLADTTVVL